MKRGPQIEAYNSGQINLQVAEAARQANESRLAREREQYAAKNRLAGAITLHDISAAKTAAGELVALERIFK